VRLVPGRCGCRQFLRRWFRLGRLRHPEYLPESRAKLRDQENGQPKAVMAAPDEQLFRDLHGTVERPLRIRPGFVLSRNYREAVPLADGPAEVVDYFKLPPQNGVRKLLSAVRDFGRFPRLRTENPLV
jgi:hypothetical protein